LDVAVYSLVKAELDAVGGDAVAQISQDVGGGMLFTEVRPKREGAAQLSVAYQDDTTLNVMVGSMWFEIFGRVEDNVDYLRGIVSAVFAGRVEEAGSVGSAFGRIYTSSGAVSVGAMHLPWPWKPGSGVRTSDAAASKCRYLPLRTV
jgi:hypothetical protein